MSSLLFDRFLLVAITVSAGFTTLHQFGDTGSRRTSLAVCPLTSVRGFSPAISSHNSFRSIRSPATFARFVVLREPHRMAQFQGILNILFKRGARQKPIEYFDSQELDALFKCNDRASPHGKRDYALFALLFNTGGRVQEVLNLTLQDLRLEPPYQARLHGKGNKVRLCLLWPATVKCLRAHVGRQTQPRRRRTTCAYSEIATARR